MNRNDFPLFSIVIPTRWRPRETVRAVRSVLAQELTDLEVIVVDDGPDDATRHAVGAIGDPRVRYVPQQHSGVAGARNRGASMARGSLLTFLDSDDEALPGWLLAFAGELSDPSVATVCCGVRIHHGGQVQERLPSQREPGAGDVPALFLAGSFAVRQQIFDRLGGYWTELTFGENTELGLRLTAFASSHGLRVANVRRPLIAYRRERRHRPPSEELLRSRLSSSRRLLARHGATLRRNDTRLLANLLGVAGVRAARLGDLTSARDFFRRSVRANPGAWKHYARLAISCMPPLATRVWSGPSRHTTE